MKIVMVEEKKHIGKVLLRHFQNQQHNTKFFIQTLLLCFFIWGSISIAVSTETDKTGPSNPSSSNKQKSKSLINKFYELAKDKDAGVRAELAETVGKTGKLEALKLLKEMATDKDLDVRRAVVKALGQTGRPEALKLLEKIIKNKLKQEKQSSRYDSRSIKEIAVTAIMEINKEATSFLAYYPIFQEDKKSKKNRYYSYYSNRKIEAVEKNIYTQKIQKANNKTKVEKQTINLANQTKKKVFQLLNKLSTDKKENIRKLVAKNASQIEDPTKALKLLEKIMKNEYKQSKQPRYSSIKDTLIESIVETHHKAASFLIYLGNEKEQKENQKKRHYHGKNYTGIYQQIIQYASNKEKAEKQAIKLTDQTKKKIFRLLNILAKDKAPGVRSKVANSIKEIKDPTKALKLLENMIKTESIYDKKNRDYHNIKVSAIGSSIEIYKRANNFLTYLDSQTEKQKKKNRYSYGSRGNIGIYNQMVQLSTHKKKAEKQVIDLANQTKKKILRLLNTLAKDKDSSVREQVVKETPVIDNLDAFNLLEKMVTDKKVDVRKEIVRALEEINNIGHYVSSKYSKVNKTSEKTNITKTMYILEKLAKDQDKGVRISAIKAMGKINQN